jgi:hypothetical protein
MLRAVVALIDERNAKVDEFIQFAVERSTYACIEASEILKHLRAMSKGLLHIPRFTAKSFLIDFANFRRSVLRCNQTYTCHRNPPD